MYVFIYVSMYCVCGRELPNMYVRMFVCMYASVYVFIYVCMYVRMWERAARYVRTYVCVYICTCVCMYVCTYVFMYVCMYVCGREPPQKSHVTQMNEQCHTCWWVMSRIWTLNELSPIRTRMSHITHIIAHTLDSLLRGVMSRSHMLVGHVPHMDESFYGWVMSHI